MKNLIKGAIGIIGILILPGCQSINQILPALSPPTTLAKQPPAASSVAAQSTATTQMEAQVLQQINAIRAKQGLGQLRSNEKLTQVARNYSRRMAEQNFFSHTSPAGDTMVQRVRSAGIFYVTIGENLFTCTNIPQPVPASVKGWMNSPGHRKNILRPEYQETGIGVWRRGDTYYFTQLFLRSLSL